MINETCNHGNKWDTCKFGCTLWEYTRTGRTHYINNDDFTAYSDGPYWNEWIITDAGGCYCVAGSKGYDLYHKGKKIKHGKTVKELKQAVAKTLAAQWE